MYHRPESLDKRIDDTLFEKLMDIAMEESDAFISFGSPQFHFDMGTLSHRGLSASIILIWFSSLVF